MTPRLRTAVTADLPGIVEVFLDCWRVGYAGVLPEPVTAAMTTDRAMTLWTDILESPAAAGVVVAETDDGIVGVTRHGPVTDRRGVVESLYVSPRHQGHGTGRALLAEATGRLRDHGADTAALWVFAANTPAIGFYRAQGWIPDGTGRTQDAFGAPEIRLVRRLDPEPADAFGRLAARIASGAPGRPAGASVGLRAPGVSRHGVAGFRTLGDDPRPMTRDTAHDLASVTKIVATTTALIRLVSDRHLRLDDPVSHHLPGFTGDGRESVTVRQLLRHRGGLREWQPVYLHADNPDAALAYVQRLPLRYRPDTGRHYSDLGFMLLGGIVETVTGLGLADAVTTLVTAPLRLDHTRYATPLGTDIAASAPGDDVEHDMVATGEPHPVLPPAPEFTRWRTRPLIGEVNDGNAFHAFGEVAGHAGLFSTLDDLLTFADTLAHYRDHTRLWRPEVVDEFLAPGPDPEQALGFRRHPFSVDGRTVTMYGHPGFVGCVVGFAPETGTALAMCGNRLTTGRPPVPTDELWTQAHEAASAELTTRSQR
ncbi:CubicO group peptidase (beta-lactamase class C family) [Stackebrandtia albiflava]|uniref:CubicO group peptidase (Beta-lactamase class C family) n=1 Tax=Stackebrandtia albiflava TaxID=406432 RepID=A0A562ULE1_9ACTN|nr:GNAT family N-acetyltransferase [Stackebrandtia albiflava]TWJ06441.1 CubicO group peptidase (beta-lactamase class C family) [Stackebrandtia albiflava]